MKNSTFFWEKGTRKRTKTRFNLLLLEYGEYFVDDVGVFQYPNPDDGSGRDFFQCDALKAQGRLKLCTKSLIFEPSDARKPLLKFPFKNMSPTVGEYTLSATQKSQCSIETSGFFTFTCSSLFEMKEEGKIGPYRQVDCADSKEPTEFFFAVSHSHITMLLSKISRLREIFTVNERGDLSAVTRLISDLTCMGPTAIFDASKLVDFHEKLRMELAISVKKIKPLVDNPGFIMMTDLRLYFQPGQLNNVGEATQHYNLSSVSRLYKRRYLLMDTALELIMVDGESVLFCFDSSSRRDFVYDVVNAEPQIVKSRITLEDMTEKWRRREISNFDYLMFVNNEAGRSLSDLAQYPVFPHVLADYTSKSLDLTNPKTFRDLSKPIGALNPQRLEFFKERMESMPPEDSELGVPPRFLYGTHYSTPGYVLYYLVRVAPEHMLCLQNGKFDSTDRMFISLAETWDSCLNNPADLKELIPEFFCGKSGDFLINISELDLGRRQTGEKLHDVELPPWAKSPKDFMKKHTKALESDYVSEHLHEWIDLIFGAYQHGQEAIDHDNLFYHITYEGAVDIDTITDARERRALEVQIQEFGQTPRQLFSVPHPPRLPLTELSVQHGAEHNREVIPPSVIVKDVGTTSAGNKPEENLVYQPDAIISESSVSIDEQCRLENMDAFVKNDSTHDNKSVVKDEATFPFAAENAKVIELGKEFQDEVARLLLEEDVSDKFVCDVFPSVEGKFASSKAETSKYELDSETTKGSKSNLEKSATVPSTFGSWVGSKIGGFWGTVASTSSRSLNSSHNSADDSANHKVENVIVEVASTVELEEKETGTSSTKVKPQSSGNMCLVSLAAIPGAAEGRQVDDILLHSSEPFKAHTEPVTCVAVSCDGRTVTSCSKDATMKVLKVTSLDHAGPLAREWTQISVRRSFTASDPPLSGCCIIAPPNTVGFPVGETAKFVLVSSWDSSLYSYSIPNACVVGRRVAHDDGISALACDSRTQKVVSGSWDASVKVWNIGQPTGLLSAVPEAEFFDHDTPIQCVALDNSCRFVAAGAEDGRICVWSIEKGGNLLMQRQISSTGRSISGLLWIQHGAKYLLLCSAIDGNLVCFDVSQVACDVISRGFLDGGLKCIQCDPLGRAGGDASLGIFAGYADGSLRVLSMLRGAFVEIDRHPQVHQSGINSLCVCQTGNVLVTGGEDGYIRVWKIESRP